MSELVAWQDTRKPCPDQECGGLAEPESDLELHFYACSECGYEFGYQRVSDEEADTCQLGVSEDVRRAASAPAERALAQQAGPVPLQISFGPPPEA